MDKETLQKIVTAGMLGTLAATIRALLTRNETPMQRIRNFLAGVCMAIFLGFVLRDVALSNFWKEIVIGCAAAFISSIWPVLEIFVMKYIKKKGDDIVSRNEHNKHIGGDSSD